MGPRGAGRRLNDQERIEILDTLAREAKVKNVDLAKRYGVSEGAIRKLKQVQDRIRDRYVLGNEHNRDKRKRGGFARNAQFERELYAWICRMRETQAYQLLPLTQTAVRQQAMLLAQKYECMAAFKASPGWFARFCSRHRLDPPMTNSTSGVSSADPPAISPVAGAVDEAKATDAAAVAAAVFQLPALPDADADVLMDEVKADAEAGTIDEQTKLAARQHNIVALGIATAAAAATVTKVTPMTTEVSAVEVTEVKVASADVKAVATASVTAPAVDVSAVVKGEASTTQAESEQKAPATSAATATDTTTASSGDADATSTTKVDAEAAVAVAASSVVRSVRSLEDEDEIFSLGL